MAKPDFGICEIEKDGVMYKIVRFDIPGGISSPEEFDEAFCGIEERLPGDLPVLLNGRGPVWAYGYMIHAAHATPAVATYDPRMKGYVVVTSHDKRFKRGQIIADPDPRNLYQTMVIAVGGPPNSGKTVFINELFEQMLKLTGSVFKQSVCPEHTGNWEHHTDPLIISRIRKKSEFSPEFLEHCLKAVDNIVATGGYKILLLDLGGKLPSAENEEILRHATHMIVVSRDEKALAGWRALGNQEHCEVFGLFGSRLEKRADGALDPLAQSKITINERTSLMSGELVNLDRGHEENGKKIQEQRPYQEAIEQIAKYLVEKKAKSWLNL
jgi:CRISPR-associated protein Csx3